MGGILYALGFPTNSMPVLFIFSIIGMSLFLYSLEIVSTTSEQKIFNRIKKTLFFSLGYCLTGYYWIPYTISEFGDIPFPLNWILGVFFSLIIAPQFFVFLFSLGIIKKVQLISPKLYGLLTQKSVYPIILAFLLTFFEYYTPQQFPAHLGHPWIQITPYLGLAPIFGAAIYSFLSYLIALTICLYFSTKKVHKINLIIIIVLIFSNLLIPLNKEINNNGYKTNIRLVQANVGNFLKISAEGGSFQAIEEIIGDYYELSTASSEAPIDLIIWPETAYPHLLSSKRMEKNKDTIPKVFKDTIFETKAELFVGGYDLNTIKRTSFESEFNTAFHFDSNANLKNVYHKMKLIPFGENLPFGFFNQYLSKMIKNISFFASGTNYTLFKTKNDAPFISGICYEILFSSFIRDYLNNTPEQASFMINLTNDSWYGDTSEPHQHLALAKWRAIEFNLPIVRMTNTGITSLIYADGSESKRLNVGEKKHLDITLQSQRRKKTFFQRVGFLSISLLVFLLVGIAHLLGRKTNLML